MSVLTELSTAPTIYETVAEIKELGALENDWDGEGAEAVSAVAISKALLIITNAAEATHARGYRWETPDVAATADGGIGLSWRKRGRSLLVIIHPHHATVVCVTKDDSGSPSRRIVNLEQVSEVVIWLLNP